MATTRCPTCQRVLHLPDDREVQTAQCPLCKSTFETKHKAIPLVESTGPRADRIAPFPAVPHETPQEVPDTSPRRFNPRQSDVDLADSTDRKKLNSAAGWLKAMSGLGLGQMILCGCCDWAMLDRRGDMQGCLLVLLPTLFLSLCVIWSAADTMQRRRSLRMAQFGGGLALTVGIFALVLGLVSVIAGMHTRDEGLGVYLVGLGVVRLITGVLGLIGGVSTISALNRRGVRFLFESKRPERN